MDAINVRDLRKSYRFYPSRLHRLKEWACAGLKEYSTQVDALRGLTFAIRAGESVGLIGRNGAGKSTLLRVLAGISPPSSGSCQVHGSLSAMIELGAQFHPDYTGRENVVMSGILFGLSRREVDAGLAAALDFAELGMQIDQPLRTYSSGMQARLAFAVSTMIRPDVLLVDEVLAVGDQYFVGKCVRHIQDYQRSGRTLVLVSHDLTLIHALCRRVLWIDQGRVAADGAPPDVCREYRRAIQEEQNAKAVTRLKTSKDPECPVTSDESRRQPITITDVQLLGEEDQHRACYVAGEKLTVRIHFRSRIHYRTPNIAVTIERADGLLMAAHTTREAELDTGIIEPGTGWFDMVYSPLLLGAGTFRVHVAITFDEPLAYGDINFDRIESAQEFEVMVTDRPYSVAVEHPVMWKREGRPLSRRVNEPPHVAAPSGSNR
jgi:lipopolysaccharide transport system ATP-binding protein